MLMIIKIITYCINKPPNWNCISVMPVVLSLARKTSCSFGT